MIGTYIYTNDLGIQKQLQVVEKIGNEYSIIMWATNGGLPCEMIGTGLISEEKLKNFLNHYNIIKNSLV